MPSCHNALWLALRAATMDYGIKSWKKCHNAMRHPPFHPWLFRNSHNTFWQMLPKEKIFRTCCIYFETAATRLKSFNYQTKLVVAWKSVNARKNTLLVEWEVGSFSSRNEYPSSSSRHGLGLATPEVSRLVLEGNSSSTYKLGTKGVYTRNEITPTNSDFIVTSDIPFTWTVANWKLQS